MGHSRHRTYRMGVTLLVVLVVDALTPPLAPPLAPGHLHRIRLVEVVVEVEGLVRAVAQEWAWMVVFQAWPVVSVVSVVLWRVVVRRLVLL